MRTCDPLISLCILKVEQLLDLAIRDNVLKTKIYKQARSQERIFCKRLKSGIFQSLRIKKLKAFVALLWTQPVLRMEERHSSWQEMNKMRTETDGKIERNSSDFQRLQIYPLGYNFRSKHLNHAT